MNFWRLEGSEDTLGHDGHGYFAGTVDLQYDLEHDRAGEGWKISFANRNTAVGGVIVVRRDIAEAHANSNPDVPDFALGGIQPSAEITTLITHDEYEEVTVETGGTNFLGRNKSGIKGSCATWSPETFKLASQSEGERDTWVMAVPCGSVYYPEAVRDRFPQWGDPPSPYDAKDAKLMVRFWNVQDPGLLASTNHEPFAEILGPENAPNSHAIMCHAIVDQDRVLLFVADHGARVLVYDVTDYLYTPPADPQPLATWTAPLSLTDEQPNTIRSIAVDHQVWTEGETTYDRIYVYAGVQRTGIQILRFAWGSSSPGDEQLVPLELVQTPGYTNWVHLRDTPGAENVLLVSDGVGLRAYGYDF